MTFEVDHDRAERMAAAIPAGVVKVAESGVRDADDATRLADAGYDAILVGETLVTAADPAAELHRPDRRHLTRVRHRSRASRRPAAQPGPRRATDPSTG